MKIYLSQLFHLSAEPLELNTLTSLFGRNFFIKTLYALGVSSVFFVLP